VTDPTAAWGCYGSLIAGADGTTIGTGAQNTTDIVNGCATSGIAARLANDFAPEHLTLITTREDTILPLIRTAGAIFLGNHSPVAVGDFLAGPSHTLPTGGSGKSFPGITADMFQRRTSIIRLDRESCAKSDPIVSAISAVEGLDAHARSVSIRAS
jgi:histidinol dehydrogenase